MQNFCQFEVDFHVINKAVHLNHGFQVRLFLYLKVGGLMFADDFVGLTILMLRID